MKAGLFGGTFNPIHNGHIQIIRYVKEKYDFKKIFLIPSANPPHKPCTDLAPAKDRYAMVQSCLKDLEGFFISDREIRRKGPSFTIDTLKEFIKEEKMDFSLLMGSDAFFDITTWRERNSIFDTVPVIVILREKQENFDSLVSFVDSGISKGYKFDREKNIFFHARKQNIIICRGPLIDISSTMIRTLVKRKKSIGDLVPSSVEKIILRKKLYL